MECNFLGLGSKNKSKHGFWFIVYEYGLKNKNKITVKTLFFTENFPREPVAKVFVTFNFVNIFYLRIHKIITLASGDTIIYRV